MTTKVQSSDHRHGVVMQNGSVLLAGNLWTSNATGVNSPRRPDGLLLLQENNYDRTITNVDAGYIQIVYPAPNQAFSGFYSSSSKGLVFAYPPNIDGWTNNHDLSLWRKVGARVNSSDFAGGAALAESRETLMMIGNSARTMARFLHHVWTGNLYGAARVLSVEPEFSRRYSTNRRGLQRKSRVYNGQPNWKKLFTGFSSAVLAFDFGWKPLYADVKSGAEAVASILDRPIKQKTRATVRTSSVVNGQDIGDAYNRFTVNYLGTRRKTIILHGVEPPGWNHVLGLDDPLSAAWEVLPFSFVVDWWLPIGSYLEARNVSRTVKYDKATVIDLQRSRWISKYRGWNGVGPVQLSSTEVEPSGQTLTYFHRYANISPSVPAPSFKPMTSDFSVKHVIDSIALLTQWWNKRPGVPYWDT